MSHRCEVCESILLHKIRSLQEEHISLLKKVIEVCAFDWDYEEKCLKTLPPIKVGIYDEVKDFLDRVKK